MIKLNKEPIELNGKNGYFMMTSISMVVLLEA